MSTEPTIDVETIFSPPAARRQGRLAASRRLAAAAACAAVPCVAALAVLFWKCL